MMHDMKTFHAAGVVALTAAALLLSGCSGLATPAPGASSDTAYSGEWFTTDIGDVYCFQYKVKGNRPVTDCDWSTLTSRGERADDGNALAGRWVFVDNHDGEVFCVVNVTKGNRKVLDCAFDYKA